MFSFSTRFIRLTSDNVLAQLICRLVEFVTSRADVRLFRDVGGAFGGGFVVRILRVLLQFPTDGMSFDHVHLVERLGSESFRAIVAFVLEFDERVHVLVGLFEMMLQDNVVAKVDATRWASERFRFHVLFLDVLLQMTETVEKDKK